MYVCRKRFFLKVFHNLGNFILRKITQIKELFLKQQMNLPKPLENKLDCGWAVDAPKVD
jgi:hypothetical protein